MRKAWAGAAITAGILLAAVVGVWGGMVFHDSIAAALGVSSSDRQQGIAAASTQGPQVQAENDHPNQTGTLLYHCGMHPWIIQDHPGTCPICHMRLTPIQNSGAVQSAARGQKKILYYWDPMLGPSSISQKPGLSAMGMNLVPVYADQVTGGPEVRIDPAVVQNMGVQTAEVRKGPLTKTVRTVGNLEVPETGLYDITLKVSGYIDKLYADQTGMHVHKGDPLFDLYSPELMVAEDELIAARKSAAALSDASPEVRAQGQSLLDGARRKLQLLDIPDALIDTIAQQDHAAKDITVRSPAQGHLEDKMIVQGSFVRAGMKLMQIKDHSTVWLEAQVYEEQLPLVKLGDRVDATVDAVPGRTFSGRIIFISPHFDATTRTIEVRVALDSDHFLLKPGMYATVLIRSQPVNDAILVPREAVIDTGTRKIAFVPEGGGHFEPRLVTTGLSGDDDQMQILSGLAPGETVVTSGQFLLDVESRTEEAIEKLRGPGQQASTRPSDTMPAMTMPAERVTQVDAAIPTAATGRTDKVTGAYLALVEYFQSDPPDKKPADISNLLDASQQLARQVPADPEHKRAITLVDAVSAMNGQTVDAQRKIFEQVGSAMVELIDSDPPSKAVAPALYVAHCPMENADWLQTQEAVRNPFLPTMRTCGAVTRTISLEPTK